jgi:hypothetical protein
MSTPTTPTRPAALKIGIPCDKEVVYPDPTSLLVSEVVKTQMQRCNCLKAAWTVAAGETATDRDRARSSGSSTISRQRSQMALPGDGYDFASAGCGWRDATPCS